MGGYDSRLVHSKRYCQFLICSAFVDFKTSFAKIAYAITFQLMFRHLWRHLKWHVNNLNHKGHGKGLPHLKLGKTLLRNYHFPWRTQKDSVCFVLRYVVVLNSLVVC